MVDSETTGNAGSEGRRARPIGLARTFIKWWAIAGGLVIVAIVLMTASSVVSDMLFSKPFPGDFEIVQMGIAIAAFAFLPYCQLEGANVTVDIFTANVSHRTILVFRLISAVIALLISVLLLERMWEGMIDYQIYNETTPIVQIPLWYAFPPILCSLALLVVASLITIAESTQEIFRPASRSL